MVEKTKTKSRVFDYFQEKEEQYAPGLAWCAGCPLELNLRFVPKVLGKDISPVKVLQAPLLPAQLPQAQLWRVALLQVLRQRI